MSAQNSPANKAARRAARLEAERTAPSRSPLRSTICRVCMKRRQASPQGICTKCFDAFTAVGQILARDSERNATVIPETVGTTTNLREVGS